MNTMKRAAELLKGVQWQYRPYDDHWHTESGYYCPECDGKKENGHTSKCALLAVITELERAQSSPVNHQLLAALEYAIKQVPELATVPGIAAASAWVSGTRLPSSAPNECVQRPISVCMIQLPMPGKSSA